MKRLKKWLTAFVKGVVTVELREKQYYDRQDVAHLINVVLNAMAGGRAIAWRETANGRYITSTMYEQEPAEFFAENHLDGAVKFLESLEASAKEYNDEVDKHNAEVDADDREKFDDLKLRITVLEDKLSRICPPVVKSRMEGNIRVEYVSGTPIVDESLGLKKRGAK